MKLMFDNIEIAEVIPPEPGRLVSKVCLLDEVPKQLIPVNLFYGEQCATFFEFKNWIANRIVPRNRVDISRVLSEMELERYSVLNITAKTKACLMEDGWWVKVYEEDSFEKDTVRGRAGMKGWDIVNGKPVLRK